MLGYDLTFRSMPRQYERILVAAVITRDPRFLRDCSGNFYVTFAMTLSRLYSRFLRVSLWCLWVQMSICVLEPVELEYFQDSWTQRVFVLCDLVSQLGLETISLARWEWTIQVPCGRVVVLFHSYHLRSVCCYHVWSFLVCLFIIFK